MTALARDDACVLGADSSTGSTKVEILSLADGRLIDQARSPHPATTPPVSEQHPDTWWQAFLHCLDQVAENLPSVRAISISGQQHGLVVLDGADQPLRPAKLWNDTTSALESQQMIDLLGRQRWAHEVGSLPGPSFTITKLKWLSDHEPATFGSVRRVGLPHDYLNLKITGRWTTDRGDASGTGYWSPREGRYRADLLSEVGLDIDSIELPRVANPFASIGTVSSHELTNRGVASDTLVAPGSGDNMSAALGLGVGPGDLVVSLGTSGTAYAVSNTPTSDETGLVAGFADATGRYLPLVCTLNATKVTESFRALLDVDHTEFDRLAMAAPQGANGLTLVPYFDGERTPNLPNASGLLSGLRAPMNRPQIARAAVEGVTCGLLDGVDALLNAGVPLPGRFFLIGGGARSQAFATSFASLSGRSVLIPEADETVARGAAVQAACVATGETPTSIAERWQLDRAETVEPSIHEEAESAEAVRARYRHVASLAGELW